MQTIASSPFVIPRRKVAPSGVGMRDRGYAEWASEKEDAGGELKGGGKGLGARLANREKFVFIAYCGALFNGLGNGGEILAMLAERGALGREEEEEVVGEA